MKNNKEKFVGNKISISTYNKMVSYSEATGRKIKRIMEEALNRYLAEEIPKQYGPKKN